MKLNPTFLAFVAALSFQGTLVVAQQPPEGVFAQAQEKIADFVASFDDDAGLGPREPSSQRAEMVDLNLDGTFEAYLYLDSPTDCGSLGCTRIILDLSEASAREMGRFIGSKFTAIGTTTGGWRDIRLDGLRLVKSRTGYVPAWRLTDSSFEAYGQRLLSDAGYDVGPIDGQIGSRTQSAIRQLEIDNGLPVSGELSRSVVAILEARRLPAAQPGGAGVAAAAPQEQASASNLGVSASAVGVSQADEKSCAELRTATFANSGDVVTNMWTDTPDGRVFGYSDGNDQIKIERTDSLVGHMAGLGDDFLLVDGPQSGTGIDAGPGADTIVVCALGDTQTIMMVGLSDTDADTIILKEDVFAKSPTNDPMLMIGGFSAVEDTLLIRIAAGTEVVFGDLWIQVGSVRVMVLPDRIIAGKPDRAPIIIASTDGQVSTPPDGYWSTTAASLPNVQSQPSAVGEWEPRTLAGEAFSEPVPYHDCTVPVGGNDVIKPAKVQRSILGTAGAILSDEPDFVVVDASRRVGYIDGKLGDDLIHVFEAPDSVDTLGGSGADVIVICSVSAANRKVHLNTGDGGAGADIDSDTIILYDDVFRNSPTGHLRDIGIFGFAPSNDRLFIEVADINDVSILDNVRNSLKLAVGQANITIYSAELLTAAKFKLGSVILVPPGFLRAASESGIPVSTTDAALRGHWSVK